MITPAQCRAARGLIEWSQLELAERAGVGIVTIRQLEAGKHAPRRATLEVVRRALEAVGVEVGITRERVRQIQTEALKRLRRLLEKEGY